MIRTTPPARSTWHQVPPGELHVGTFTDVYGFEFRPGYAWRCGRCPWTGAGFRTMGQAETDVLRHLSKEGCSVVFIRLRSSERSRHLAELWDPKDWTREDG